MFGKIMITIVVLVMAWLVIRTRLQAGGRRRPTAARGGPLIPAGVLRALAYGVVSVMVAGTALYLFQGWVRRARPSRCASSTPTPGRA